MFCPNRTFVYFKSGESKPLSEVWYGDRLLDGDVKSVKSSVINDTLYIYKGVRVAGNTPVKVDGKWELVKDVPGVIPLYRNPSVKSVETYTHVVPVSNKKEVIRFGDSFLYGMKAEFVNNLMGADFHG